MSEIEFKAEAEEIVEIVKKYKGKGLINEIAKYLSGFAKSQSEYAIENYRPLRDESRD